MLITPHQYNITRVYGKISDLTCESLIIKLMTSPFKSQDQQINTIILYCENELKINIESSRV